MTEPLQLGGVSALTLANTYQTPLYVYDVAQIRQNVRAFQGALQAAALPGVVSYASKAFCTTAIYQVMADLNVHVDVVSGGELATAINADFPMDRVSFHGNNKSEAELIQAIEAGVGTIIVDNAYELELLQRVLTNYPERIQNILLRVAPGITAHTHAYDQTGKTDSKFGFDLASGQADEAAQAAIAAPQLNLLGIHGHIGSQIFEVAGYEAEAEVLLATLSHWHQRFDWTPTVLNLGGGFGISYTDADTPLPASDFLTAIAAVLHQTPLAFPLPAVWIEPGRAIVGEAGTTLYRIGARKDIPGLRPYVAVDGGMGDNIRPALYQADYTAVLAKVPAAKPVETVHLVGKYCESGDVLIDACPLPASEPGDVVAVLATGAYGYSMASNYNRNERPAVVFVESGHHQLVVARETQATLIALDRSYRKELN